MTGVTKLTKEQRTEAINGCWENMERAQMMIDSALTTYERRLAAAIYEANHALYLLLTEDRQREKAKRTDDWRYHLD